MQFKYDAHSATIYDTETDEVICRDVDPRFGVLLAGAGEMREALIGLMAALAAAEPKP